MKIKCKYCHSEKIKKIKKIYSLINKMSYNLYECSNCKSRFFDLHQYDIELSSMYDNLSHRDIFPVDFIPSRKWEKEKNIILKVLNRSPNSVLDVGCRTGDFLMHFNKNIRREGVELSKNFYNTGKQRGLQIYNDYLENIDFKESYDVVSCYAIIEHLENPLKFIDKLNSTVSKDGVLVIMIPAFQSLKAKFHNIIKPVWHMYSPPEHLNFFSRKFLDSYLKEKGFTLHKRYYRSGGMTILKKNTLLKKVILLINSFIDRSFFNKLPLFDHMYSYYIKSPKK